MVDSMDDRSQIEQLIYEYTFRLDGGDFEGFGELFADAEWGLLADGLIGFSLRGTEEVTAWVRENIRVYDGLPMTSHVTTNVIVDVDGGGESASARSYLTVFQGVPSDFPLQVIFTGGYRDTFAKRGGVWRFNTRLIVPRCVGDMSAHVPVG
jgi:hypothetical protein